MFSLVFVWKLWFFLRFSCFLPRNIGFHNVFFSFCLENLVFLRFSWFLLRNRGFLKVFFNVWSETKNPQRGRVCGQREFSIIYIWYVFVILIKCCTFYEYFGSHNTNYTSNLSLTFQNNIYTRWMIN